MNDNTAQAVTPHLHTWFTGVTRSGAHDRRGPAVYVADRDHLDTLVASYGADATYFVSRDVALDAQVPDSPVHDSPAHDSTGHDAPVLLDVDGDPGDMDEIYLCSDRPDGPIAVRIGDYSSGPYVSILGSTTIRVSSDDDYAAFLDDADTALGDGVFQDFLTNPAVVLADLVALGFRSHTDFDGPSIRLVVSAAGEVSVSPHGSSLGEIAGFSPAAVGARWDEIGSVAGAGSPVPLAQVVTEDIRARGLLDRPWIARYLHAVEAVRRLRAHGFDDLRVSGFGYRIDPSVPDDDRDDWALPILAYTRENAFVFHDWQAKKISLEAGALLERVIATGGYTDEVPTGGDPTDRLLAALVAQGISFTPAAVQVRP